MFIGGEWVEALDEATYEDLDPYTGEVFATVASASAADAGRAVDAAAAAFPGWAGSPPGERRRLLLKAADVLERRQEEVAGIFAGETGGTFGWGMFNCFLAAGMLREAAAQTYGAVGEVIPSDSPGVLSMALRQPAGVVVGIAPWNAPLILGTRAVALPLAYGNTVVLKPSEESPVLAGLLIAEVLEEAGFPAGVVNVVTHRASAAAEVGEALVSHPRTARISFTGSSETGRKVAVTAARHLKRVLLELGGKNPLLVLSDADLDYAVEATAFGAYLNQGQICMSADRVIVERSIAAEYTERLVRKAESLQAGDPRDPRTFVGPLINRRALEKVMGLVDEARSEGAQVLCGGHAEGLVYPPTVVRGVAPRMRLYREESFGPVAPIVVVEDREEALAVANDTPFGLSAGIITRDFEAGLDLAQRLESGIVHINDQPVDDAPQVPFGGVKDSGVGRFGSRAALDEFTELRWITIQRTRRTFPGVS
ncbi:MAG: aldehyde dehydrogenase family protein [Candidatus Dormibacterales bacterium]